MFSNGCSPVEKLTKFSGLLLALILCFAMLAGCGKISGKAQDEKPVVAVSIVPEETFVKAVCGDLVSTVVMVPPGHSPENYEPEPMQMERFSDADIYFSIGVPTEAANILPSVSAHTRIVSLADAAAEMYDELQIGADRDPHVWLSPKRAIIMVETIAREISALDSANASVYAANAESYIAELETVDLEIKAALEGVANRKFVVFHPAFGYLADDYGLEMFALEEEGKEATAEHLQEMIDLAKAEDIKVIFYQAETDSSQSVAYAEEIGGEAAMLAPLSGDYINNLRTMAKTMAEAMK